MSEGFEYMQFQIPILKPTFQTLPKVFEQHPGLGLLSEGQLEMAPVLRRASASITFTVSIQLLLGKTNLFVHEKPLARPRLG